MSLLTRVAPGRLVATIPLARSGIAAPPSRSSSTLTHRYRRMVMASDAFGGAVGAFSGLAVLRWRFHTQTPAWYLLVTALLPLVWVAAVAAQRGYEQRFLGTGSDEYRRLADAALVTFTVAAAGSYILRSDLSRGYLISVLPIAFALSMVGRHQLRGWLFRRRRRGEGLQRVLIVGNPASAGHLAEQFDQQPWHGLRSVGVAHPTLDGVLEAVERTRPDALAVVSDPDLSGHTLRRLAWHLEERGIDLIVSPGIIEVAGPRLSIRPMAGLSLLHLERPATAGGRLIIKAVLDRVIGAVLLLLALPVLACAALAVRLDSPGPMLFRQTRVGVAGRPFRMVKLRSMVADAEQRREQVIDLDEGNGVQFKIRQDPRVTRVGAVLRRFSIDELPQLWNVVTGEMSLVGPRPPLPEEVAGYDSDAVRRLRVRPGMTGLWQVSGRSDLSWEESLRLDLRYVDNWSFWLDFLILWRTWRAVLGRSGAY